MGITSQYLRTGNSNRRQELSRSKKLLAQLIKTKDNPCTHKRGWRNMESLSSLQYTACFLHQNSASKKTSMEGSQMAGNLHMTLPQRRTRATKEKLYFEESD
jgi:hypothetical protein